MLSELLRLVGESPYPARVEQLSRSLGAQPTAVEAMLETLAQRGRVLAIDPANSVCSECALRGKCDRPMNHGRCYVILRREA